MALDLSRFAKAFFEEAQEHIAVLENLLIHIDLRAPDAEALNAIFRAVHSIKGGAAAFGHTALADFTHDFETILDRVRKGKLALSKPLVDISLKASDVMGQHLLALEKEFAPDLQAMQEIQTNLGYLTNEAVAPAEIINGQHLKASSTAGSAIEVPRFQVSIRLQKEQYGSETTLAELKKDIAGLGSVTNVKTLDIDAGLIEFSFGLDAEIDAAELKESLEFLAPLEAVEIIESSALPTDTQAGANSAVDDSFGFFDDMEAAAPLPPKLVQNIRATTVGEADIQLSSLADNTSIRVNVEKIDQLINLVGELVIAESMVMQSVHSLSPTQQLNFSAGLTQFQRNTRDLQDAVLAIRMLPISFVFTRLPRLTRDICDRTGKEIELELFGEETELDKSVIEKIADPLTHLVRNAIDHGVEAPDVRMAKNKKRAGRLTVRAAHVGGNIVISVSDDGAGLNREKILSKARELHLEVENDWTDQQVWSLIFTPGFSTASAVTGVSGRGVGMDVVWRNVHALGGRVTIDSVENRGTTMMIKLPLTLAILDGMSIAANNNIFIIPLANIVQSMQPTSEEIKTISGHRMVLVREEYVPILSLNDIFKISTGTNEYPNILVIMEFDNKRAALLIDDLLGQHQVVLKSLETNYQKIKGVSGATILGDGRVALILDAAYLVSVAHSANKTSLPLPARYAN